MNKEQTKEKRSIHVATQNSPSGGHFRMMKITLPCEPWREPEAEKPVLAVAEMPATPPKRRTGPRK